MDESSEVGMDSPLACAVCFNKISDIIFLVTQPDANNRVCEHSFHAECIEDVKKTAAAATLLKPEKPTLPLCPVCQRVILGTWKSPLVAQVSSELKLMKHKNKQVMGDNKSLVNDFQKLGTENLALRQLAEKNDSDVAKLKEEIANSTKTNQEKLENSTKEVHQLKEQIEKHNKVNAVLKSKVDELKAQISNINSQHESQIEEKQRNAQEKIATQSEELEQKEKQLKTLQKQLTDLMQIQKNSNEQYTRISKQLEDQHLQFKDRENKLNEKEAEISKLSARLEDEKQNAHKWRSYYEASSKMPQSPGPISTVSPTVELMKSTEKDSGWGLKGWQPYINFWKSRKGVLLQDSNSFTIQERRGASRSSSVFKAFRARTDIPNSNQVCALKRIENSTQNPLTISDFRETLFLNKFDHKNIIKLDGVVRDFKIPNSKETGEFMMFPFVPYDLQNFLDATNTFNLKHKQIKSVMFQILSSIYYIHSAEIVHRNIKLTSILSDESCNIKLASFGHARSLKNTPLSQISISRFSAPELCYLDAHNVLNWKSCDLWSCGIVLLYLVMKRPPFEARDRTQLLQEVLNIRECSPDQNFLSRFPVVNVLQTADTKNKKSLRDLVSKDLIDEEMLDLLSKLLKFDPERRPTAAECLLHPYFGELSGDSLDSHRTCVGLTNELVDSNLSSFVETYCGGLP